MPLPSSFDHVGNASHVDGRNNVELHSTRGALPTRSNEANEHSFVQRSLVLQRVTVPLDDRWWLNYAGHPLTDG